MSGPVLNLDKLNTWRQMDPEGGTGFIKKLITIYLSSAPAFQIRIEDAIQAADSDALVKAAHTFKSSASNVGAELLADICRQLEGYGDKNQPSRAVELLAEMQNESQRVITALEELLEKC
ncbi:MAG: Hpt domain-containing protein [Nitrosomonas sp.]|nr:Hpt domain-containing protein [Nitrosomonas sp.]UJP01034.1 MAG: Hpt domain-containing protein [Nitrosomonas sp.]